MKLMTIDGLLGSLTRVTVRVLGRSLGQARSLIDRPQRRQHDPTDAPRRCGGDSSEKYRASVD